VGTEMDIEEIVGGKKGFSRRTLIKGGAILGGTIWVAPVIDSFVSPASATSLINFCCSCWNPVAGQAPTAGFPAPAPNQGEADDSPASLIACVNYCAGYDPAAGGSRSLLQPWAYYNYTWCGPSATGLAFVANTSIPANSGCYYGNTLTPDTGTCVAGVITYPSGLYNGTETYTSAPSGPLA
jgi:hypothetical protein